MIVLADRPCCDVVAIAGAKVVAPSYTGTFIRTADVRDPGDARPVYQNDLTGAYLWPGRGWNVGPDCKEPLL